MKKIILFLLFSIVSFAQVPQGMSHRGIAYNSNGTILTGPISLRVRILQGSSNGSADYVETYNLNTNLSGQYNINIGQGNLVSGNFSSIDWSTGQKWLEIGIAPGHNQTNYFIGSSQLMSVPYALHANSTYNSIEIIENIATLRTKTGVNGQIVFIKKHTFDNDGGEGFFYWRSNIPANTSSCNDNDGTIIRASNTIPGAWIRSIDGKINVNYFGTYGNSQNDDGERIQKAIDFAYNNQFQWGYTNAGATVYIPTGNYLIKNTLKLKSGVSIEGENYKTTILKNGNTTFEGNMIELDSGRIEGINISNITFTGNQIPGQGLTKNCMHLKATVGEHNDGGIWGSSFKNIKINQFNGSGIILEGGGGFAGYTYNLPNQGLIFENVHIERQTDNSNCLLIKGQQGQLTFINCGFDGRVYDGNLGSTSFKTSRFYNVVIENDEHVQSASIIFITSTFQYSEFGVYMKFAENVTFDNCWFEILDKAIGITQSADTSPLLSSSSINILNSRFANASGFGSYSDNVSNLGYTIGTGSCIYIEESNVNVFNNFVTVSDTFHLDNKFIMNYSAKSLINTGNNTFKLPRLGYTYGLANGIINVISNSISTYNNKFISVNASANIIKQINSNLEAGQTLTIKAEGSSIKFDNTKNIKMIKSSPIILNHDEIATFIKVDGGYINQGVHYSDYWILVSITKVN